MLNALLKNCSQVFKIIPYFSNFYIYLLWSLQPLARGGQQLAPPHYEHGRTDYDMPQIESGIKEQIQSAFKCTRIYYPIWKKNNTGVRSRFDTEAADWVDKYFSNWISLLFHPKRVWKANWIQKGILFAASAVCVWRFTAAIQEARTACASPFPISLAFVINISF